MVLSPDSLPRVLEKIDSFAALPEGERLKLTYRFQYIRELVERVEEFFMDDGKSHNPEEVLDLFDNLELDLMNCLSVKSTQEKVSPWLVHSSWTFETSPKNMVAALSQKQFADLQKSSPTSACSVMEFVEWISRITVLVRDLRQAFLSADTLDSAVGNFVALDIALTTFLLGVSRQRLNPQFSR